MVLYDFDSPQISAKERKRYLSQICLCLASICIRKQVKQLIEGAGAGGAGAEGAGAGGGAGGAVAEGAGEARAEGAGAGAGAGGTEAGGAGAGEVGAKSSF